MTDETLRLEPGDTAPAFTLESDDGGRVSLTDFAGESVILYFYPQAMTPGCTTQACDFRDNLASLAGAGYRVIGVSKDSPEVLRRFREQEHITFPLLSDESLDTHRAYGTWGEKNSYGRVLTGTLRSTFVIDPTGSIRLAFYNAKATGHVAMLRRKLGLD
ncbi:thioredoxin-dependent thiol peroxidase [Rathayibacter sp. YIM 133350]|uniref:thioredoxin-dependent thiol peroxidase n=1 Tax=Rathayibacter sp. YIM 133350 TaxID=3131992 RepID=UPI00307FA977